MKGGREAHLMELHVYMYSTSRSIPRSPGELTLTWVQRSSLVIIAHVQRERPGDEARCVIHVYMYMYMYCPALCVLLLH